MLAASAWPASGTLPLAGVACQAPFRRPELACASSGRPSWSSRCPGWPGFPVLGAFLGFLVVLGFLVGSRGLFGFPGLPGFLVFLVFLVVLVFLVLRSLVFLVPLVFPVSQLPAVARRPPPTYINF